LECPPPAQCPLSHHGLDCPRGLVLVLGDGVYGGCPARRVDGLDNIVNVFILLATKELGKV